MPESALVEKAAPLGRRRATLTTGSICSARSSGWTVWPPDAREAVRLAALTHDMERAFPGPDSPVMTSLDDPVYERLHSERSARIVRDWLRGHGADDALVRDVEELILAHETGGSHEADLVQAADSLSFLETNIDLFLGFVRSGRFSIADVRTQVRAFLPPHSGARREGAGAAALRESRRPPRLARADAAAGLECE